MTRTSTRLSSGSTPRKRLIESSESDFDDGNSTSSDFESTKKKNTNKRVKRESPTSEEDDEEDNSEGETRSRGTFIPFPKARVEGDVPYEDGRVHENTMLFLKDLKANNKREWMRFNDEDFRNAQKDFASFIEQLSELVIEKDFTIPELPSKDIIFRIYRDVRFSHDKTPYKPNFSAAWSRTGKKGPYAAYYFHLEPGRSFIGGGLWSPEADKLEKLREDIDQTPHKLRRALMSDELRRDFLRGAKDEEAAVEQFTAMNSENALKTKPRGYEVDHKDIKLLRLKTFTMRHKLDDSEITSADGLQRIADLVGSMVPFITHLNRVVMPDRNAADSSDDDDAQEGADDQ